MSNAVTAGSDTFSPAVEELMRTTRERHEEALSGRERLVGAPFGLALLPVIAALAIFIDDPRPLRPALALVLLAGFVLAARVEFQTGGGYAVPTQLVFVPMLFLLPAAMVPAIVGVGYVLARATALPRQSRPVERMVGEFANAWYAVAPVLVIVLTHSEQPRLSAWPIYVAALAAQLSLDALVSCVRCAVAFGTPPADLLREVRWAHQVDLLLAPAGFAAALASVDVAFAWLLVLPILALLSMFARERTSLVDRQLELAHAYRGTALLLGDVVEGDDEYTGRHSRGVGLLALEVADELKVDDRTRRDIEFSALLHDVGKVAMPKEIINKAGPLDDDEWAVMRTHTIEGQRMLARVGGVLDTVGMIVRASHERWDGTGYPDGLAGAQIPIAARVVTCCDAFSAMTTDRPYRPARSLREAVDELRACAGTHFDPVVVDALVTIVERHTDEERTAEERVADGTLERLASELARAIPLGLRIGDGDVAQTMLRTAVDGVAEGILVHGRDGRVRASNPEAERILGVPAAYLVGAPTAALGLEMLDDDGMPLATRDAPWARTLRTGEPCSHVTVGIVQSDGEVRWLAVSCRPLRRFSRSRPHAVVSSVVDVAERRLREQALERMAGIDPRTGLPSRRCFEDILEHQIQRSRRYGEDAVLLVLSVSESGSRRALHAQRLGDEILRHLAALLRARLRATDSLTRLSGHEFAVLLPHTDATEGRHVANELVEVVESEPLTSAGSNTWLEANVGLTAIGAATISVADALTQAHHAPSGRLGAINRA